MRKRDPQEIGEGPDTRSTSKKMRRKANLKRSTRMERRNHTASMKRRKYMR